MSNQFIKWFVALLICLVLIFVMVVLLRGIGIEKYRDGKVVVGEMRRPWDVFAAHVSRPQYLTAAGRTYHRVRGIAPYYLEVPGIHSILFVTETTGGRVTFHVLNLDTKQEVQFDGGTSGFGWAIGKSAGRYSDYIERADSNHIAIVKRTSDWKETILLNLSTKSIEHKETLYFNARGQTTNR